MNLPVIPTEPFKLPLDADMRRHFGCSPESAAENTETVLMHFPTEVILVADVDGKRRQILYSAGFNDVPVELADHWFLKAHGVVNVLAAAKKVAKDLLDPVKVELQRAADLRSDQIIAAEETAKSE